jgi:ABC-type lipoprotein release transport system permease subunit
LLFNTSPRDPLVFGSVLIGIALVALFAAGVPGLRASRVDPMEAIRGD